MDVPWTVSYYKLLNGDQSFVRTDVHEYPSGTSNCSTDIQTPNLHGREQYSSYPGRIVPVGCSVSY